MNEVKKTQSNQGVAVNKISRIKNILLIITATVILLVGIFLVSMFIVELVRITREEGLIRNLQNQNYYTRLMMANVVHLFMLILMVMTVIFITTGFLKWKKFNSKDFFKVKKAKKMLITGIVFFFSGVLLYLVAVYIFTEVIL